MTDEERADGIKWVAAKIEQKLIEALGRNPTPAEFAMFTIGWKMREKFTEIIQQNKGEQSK